MKSILMVILCAMVFTVSAQKKVGDAIENFKLKNVDGKMVSLTDYKDAKGFIVIFHCNHCPFSQAYEQRILELDKAYKSKGFPVLAINPNDATKVPDDSYEKMIARAKELQYTFPYLHDESQEVAKMFGAARTPHVFLLSADKKTGAWKVVYIGSIDNDTEGNNKDKVNYVEDAIGAVVNGKEPKTKETKAIGCTIKWKN